MAKKTAILAVRIITDAVKAARELQGFGKEVDQTGKRLDKASGYAAVAVGALGLVGKAAYDQASALQQASGAVESVYKEQTAAVNKLAKDSADRLGLARSEYKDTAAVFGAQLKNMGTDSKQLVPLTDQLITLGSDLAATFGGTTSDAVAALSSLLRGERDPIERYGVSIKQADIAARIAAKGQTKLTGEAKKSAETQATLDLLLRQTADASGQFAREAGTAAGAEARRNASLKDTSATLGRVLLPIMTAFNTALAGAAKFAEENSTAVVILAGTIGALAVGVLAVNAAYKIYQSYALAAAAAQWVMNSALLASPITWLILLIVALIATFVLAYKKSDTFRGAVDAIGTTGKRVFDAIVEAIKTVIEWVGNLIQKIKDINWPSPPGWVQSIGSGIGGLFGSYTPAGGGAGYALAPRVFAAPGELKAAGPSWTVGALGGGGGGGVSIVVNGFVGDEDTLMRKIVDGLDDYYRRRGGRP